VSNAISSLLASASALNASSGGVNPVRFALYDFGTSVTSESANQVFALSSDLAAAQTAANSIGLMSTPSPGTGNDANTQFTRVFNGLNSVIPNGGDGSSQANSLKLVMFISDGLNDDTNSPCSELLSGNRCQAPITVSLCNALKARGIEVGVLYTTYLPITANSWYNTYVAPYNPGPWSPSPNSAIAANMKACASSGLYQEVGPNDSLTGALNAIFNNYLAANARITG